MLPENRIPTHPGEILQEEFLAPLGLTQVALAEHLGIPVQRVNEIVRGKRGVTPEIAWLLAQALGTTPEFWSSLQANYDLDPSARAGRRTAQGELTVTVRFPPPPNPEGPRSGWGRARCRARG